MCGQVQQVYWPPDPIWVCPIHLTCLVHCMRRHAWVWATHSTSRGMVRALVHGPPVQGWKKKGLRGGGRPSEPLSHAPLPLFFLQGLGDGDPKRSGGGVLHEYEEVSKGGRGAGGGNPPHHALKYPETTCRAVSHLHARPACWRSEPETAHLQPARHRPWYVWPQRETPPSGAVRHLWA